MEESLIRDKGFPGRLRMGLYPLLFFIAGYNKISHFYR